MDATVIVRGEAEIRVTPDRATLRVSVAGEGSNRDVAYAEAARIAGKVDELVAGYGDAVANATTASLAVSPRTRWHRGENVQTGWRAGRTSNVEFVSLDRLGEAINELSMAGATVTGPSWTVDPANIAHSEARRAAVDDARRRAEDYAAALGLRLGAVVRVTEPDAHRGGGRMYAQSFAMAADEDPGIIEVTPDEVTIDAAVEIEFDLVAGT